MAKRKTNRLLPYMGSNTENAEFAGSLLDGCSWVGIPFAGGMSEVPHIKATQILASDRHRHVINLCAVVADPSSRKWLQDEADAFPYHPDILLAMQDVCRNTDETCLHGTSPDRYMALAYFVCCWMGRGGDAGSERELVGNLPVRWNANGGGSNRRYRTAIEALDAWGAAFRRCEFVCLDAFEFLEKCKDEEGIGIYVDCPWPDAGDAYLHKFNEDDQRKLAEVLLRFSFARVVVRFGEHPLIERLYRQQDWTWIDRESRNQANVTKREVYLTRNDGR